MVGGRVVERSWVNTRAFVGCFFVVPLISPTTAIFLAHFDRSALVLRFIRVNMKFVAVLAVLALVVVATTGKRRRRGMEQALKMTASGFAGTASGPHYFEQRLTHFDGSNEQTWQQAYYVNDTFWKGPESGAPVFLCVGGEGPAFDPSVTVDSVHCSNAVDWLEETGALFLAVQHRYYGCSKNATVDCPVNNFDQPTEALKFLNSKQALGDLARFHQYATDTYKLDIAKNKWISWGGSYPGMLASWVRLKFPHLIHASVASSAPVHTKLAMPEYNDHVAFAFGLADVGGSDQCVAAITSGHAEIGAMMKTDDGRKKLKVLFPSLPSADWLKTRANQAMFAGEGVAQFPAQDNDPSCTDPACNIEKICEMMATLETDHVAALAKVASVQAAWDKTGFFYSFEETKAADELPAFWFWQTCAEMGFYQTCDVGSKCMYTQGLNTLEDNMGPCTTMFGIDAATVAENVNYTDLYYGGLHPSGTKVLWPNGEVDPWSTLSVLKSPGLEQPVLYVKGASHHFWTHVPKPTDQKPIVQARLAIRKQVSDWLSEP